MESLPVWTEYSPESIHEDNGPNTETTPQMQDTHPCIPRRLDSQNPETRPWPGPTHSKSNSFASTTVGLDNKLREILVIYPSTDPLHRPGLGPESGYSQTRCSKDEQSEKTSKNSPTREKTYGPTAGKSNGNDKVDGPLCAIWQTSSTRSAAQDQNQMVTESRWMEEAAHIRPDTPQSPTLVDEAHEREGWSSPPSPASVHEYFHGRQRFSMGRKTVGFENKGGLDSQMEAEAYQSARAGGSKEIPGNVHRTREKQIGDGTLRQQHSSGMHPPPGEPALTAAEQSDFENPEMDRREQHYPEHNTHPGLQVNIQFIYLSCKLGAVRDSTLKIA